MLVWVYVHGQYKFSLDNFAEPIVSVKQQKN